MLSVKTAISLKKPLLTRATALAQSMKVSRSRLFELALEEFLERHKNRELLEQINAAYADEPDKEERAWLNQARRSHSRLLEEAW